MTKLKEEIKVGIGPVRNLATIVTIQYGFIVLSWLWDSERISNYQICTIDYLMTVEFFSDI